ncbi:MAG: hypothetical protein ABSB63_10430 [Spirochaetia bacterium]
MPCHLGQELIMAFAALALPVNRAADVGKELPQVLLSYRLCEVAEHADLDGALRVAELAVAA